MSYNKLRPVKECSQNSYIQVEQNCLYIIVPPLDQHYKSITTLSKMEPYILYFIKANTSMMGSCNLDISSGGNFTMKQSRKIG